MSKTKVQTPPGPLQTERLSSGNRKLIRDLVVKLDGGPKITVPKGFEMDFSSIPWFARWFVDWAKVDIAGVVHDFLYWCPKHAQKLGITTRRRADDVWWEAGGGWWRTARTDSSGGPGGAHCGCVAGGPYARRTGLGGVRARCSRHHRHRRSRPLLARRLRRPEQNLKAPADGLRVDRSRRRGVRALTSPRRPLIEGAASGSPFGRGVRRGGAAAVEPGAGRSASGARARPRRGRSSSPKAAAIAGAAEGRVVSATFA